MAQPRDIILIAGKGHETYQEFADRTVPFDDVAVAASALEGRRSEGQH
jgi:UDP-N-acetylmuramyl tripeptide synthase